MMLEQLDVHKQKNELWPNLTAYTKLTQNGSQI